MSAVLTDAEAERLAREMDTAARAWQLPPAFAAMRPYPQWFIYRLFDRDPTTSKYRKEPIDARTRVMPLTGHGGINQCADWATVARVVAELQATARNGDLFVPGFWLTTADPFWFLDIDACVIDGPAWSPLALALLERFPSAARETSSSGQGWHIIGSGTLPAHSNKNTAVGLELYHADRGIALTFENVAGNAAADCTPAAAALVAEHFPPRAAAAESPEAGEDDGRDGEYLERSQALSAALAARDFPSPSERDLALACELLTLCRGDAPRAKRLLTVTSTNPKFASRAEYLADRAVNVVVGREADALAKVRAMFDRGPLPTPPPVTTIAASATVHVDGLRVDRSDQGNGNLLVALADGTLRYVGETKQWLYWNKNRWQIDEHQVFVNGRALHVGEHYTAEARQLEEYGQRQDALKWATKCRSKNAIDSMVTQARKVAGVPISVNELDRNPWLLGVENGVVDLRTGELRPDARDELVTKRCPLRYNLAATAPRWEQAIREITGAPVDAERDASGATIAATVGRFVPRPALASYLQRALGYGVTGTTREQKFFVAIGDGSNGKGVIFDTLLELLGPYAQAIPSEIFMATKNAHDAERPTSLAASLAGARFVVSSETKDGQQLDIGVVKNHTGDKKLTARKMRSDPITFEITHKPWLLTNAQPRIDHMDAAIRGRLHIVPFDRRWNRPGESDRDPALPDGDKELMAHILEHEREGALAWLVRGAMLYQQEGLAPPPEVAERTREYVLSQDHVSRWLVTLDRCAARDGILASDLFEHFRLWCTSESIVPSPSTATAFGLALKKRGVDKFEGKRGNSYGLKLRIPPPP
jgi:putative DNA primase/helicase